MLVLVLFELGRRRSSVVCGGGRGGGDAYVRMMWARGRIRLRSARYDVGEKGRVSYVACGKRSLTNCNLGALSLGGALQVSRCWAERDAGRCTGSEARCSACCRELRASPRRPSNLFSVPDKKAPSSLTRQATKYPHSLPLQLRLYWRARPFYISCY